MRSVPRLKMGYYPLPKSEGIKLRGLLEFSALASVVDPCVEQGTALYLVTSGAEVLRYGIELDAERALAAQVCCVLPGCSMEFSEAGTSGTSRDGDR